MYTCVSGTAFYQIFFPNCIYFSVVKQKRLLKCVGRSSYRIELTTDNPGTKKKKTQKHADSDEADNVSFCKDVFVGVITRATFPSDIQGKNARSIVPRLYKKCLSNLVVAHSQSRRDAEKLVEKIAPFHRKRCFLIMFGT